MEKLEKSMGFGKRLMLSRKNRKMSLEQLANLLEVNRKALSNYEKSISYPRMVLIEKMAMHLNVTITYLIGEADED